MRIKNSILPPKSVSSVYVGSLKHLWGLKTVQVQSIRKVMMKMICLRICRTFLRVVKAALNHFSAFTAVFYACEIGIMSNNRVEVHVGAKTSRLKKGMNDAEKIVKATALNGLRIQVK